MPVAVHQLTRPNVPEDGNLDNTAGKTWSMALFTEFHCWVDVLSASFPEVPGFQSRWGIRKSWLRFLFMFYSVSPGMYMWQHL